MANAKESKPVAKVKGVVLFNCWAGKLGDVVEYDAETAAKVEAEGYIDTHPNALKASKAA